MSSASSRPSSAPFYKVPASSLVSIEHPCIIKSSVDRAVNTLGGPSKLSALSNVPLCERVANLTLCPEDPLSRIMDSTNVGTKNLLLKITVPNCKGRQRKRRSDAPGNEASEKSQSEVLRSILENPHKTQVEVIGRIAHTHRFRSVPDFVDSTAGNPFMQKFKQTILPFQYDTLKKFYIDDDRKTQTKRHDVVPPPVWSHSQIPFNYNYRQNPSVRATVDPDGALRLYNSQAPAKPLTQYLLYENEEVPTSPSADLPPLSSFEPTLQEAIRAAQKLFNDRPIWSKRALLSSLPENAMNAISINQTKHIYQYLGYMFENGPWRDACVKYGVDPRKDSKYRHYQTLTFMLDSHPLRRKAELERARPPDAGREQRRTHIFNGKSLSLDGKIWQICDITDPQLQQLASTTVIQETCDRQTGFFHTCTLAKIKTITRDKMDVLLAGHRPLDRDYIRLMAFPDAVDGGMPHGLVLDNASRKEAALASRIRSLIVSKRRFDEIAAQGGEKIMSDMDETDQVDSINEVDVNGADTTSEELGSK